MPEIFEPNLVDPFPPGESPLLVNPKIGMWPKPNSGRIDSHFRWLSDSEFRPIATRHVLRFDNKDSGPPFVDYFEWFYYDLEIKGPAHAAGESGTSRTGRSVSIDMRYVSTPLPLVQSQFGYASPGVRIVQTMRVPGDPNLIRTSEYPDIQGTVTVESRFKFNQQYRLQPWVFAQYSIGRDPLDQGTVSGTWDQKVARWFPVSECYELSQYEPV